MPFKKGFTQNTFRKKYIKKCLLEKTLFRIGKFNFEFIRLYQKYFLPFILKK
jgi:hypothetical protein